MVKSGDGRLRRHAFAVVACLFALVPALLAGCGSGDGGGADDGSGGSSQQVVRVQPVQRDRWTYARARFREACAGCHSLDDAGAHGPRYDLDRAEGITENRARYAIAEGEPGMPPWKHVLSKREYEELVAYVSTVAKTLPGESDWTWQIQMREEGERWRPGDPPPVRPGDAIIAEGGVFDQDDR